MRTRTAYYPRVRDIEFQLERRLCTAKTKAGYYCLNPAWWYGGRCPKHVDRAWGFGEWLAGYAVGLADGSLPKLRRIEVECWREDNGWDGWVTPHDDEREDGATLGDPVISIRMGGRGGAWESIRTRARADPDEALVQVDRMLAGGQIQPGDTFHDRVLKRFHECVRDALAVRDALRDGSPIPEITGPMWGWP